MFCPSCGDEFRDGFDRCPDCATDLVSALPPEPEHDLDEFVELVSTGDLPFLMVLRSILNAAGIPHLVQGEEALRIVTVLPSGNYGTPVAVHARLFVRQNDYPEALEILSSASESGDHSFAR